MCSTQWESQVLEKINGEFAPRLVYYSEGELGMDGYPVRAYLYFYRVATRTPYRTDSEAHFL